jgi:hypothetical protein
MDYNNFKIKNKEFSGALSTENYLRKNYTDWYFKLSEFKKNNNLLNRNFKELLYCYFTGDTKDKMCICGNPLNFYSIEKGYSKYCSVSCSNKNTVGIIKKIKEEKYGDPNFNNKEKFKKTIKEKIRKDGEKILEKRRKSKMEKYGDPNYTNTEKIRKSKKKTTILEMNDKISIYEMKVIDVFENSSYLVYCDRCKKESKILNCRINLRVRNSIDPCPSCNNYNSGISSTEKEVVDFISTLGVDFIENDKKILGGSEIDIYLPSKKIGFEYNGLYWHSEMHLDPDYHLIKQRKAEEKGIKLINIWADDWEFKKEIVKSKIKHLLGITENNIFARKCKIDLIDFKTAKKFLNENHIQGFCPFKIAIGLIYENKLVSLCTFGSRKITGKCENEILRFTNLINYHIPGGFSKMLKEYIRIYNPESLVTFADKSWSPFIENTYTKNGFVFIKETDPNYWYIVGDKRSHRYNFRKNILVRLGYPKELTEREIMASRKIYRIYDCGQYKYKLI